MEVKFCFCVLLFAFSQFYFLKDAAAWRPIGSYFKFSLGWSHFWNKCENDTDCESNMTCYTETCQQCNFYGRTVGVCRTTRMSVEECPTSEHMVCQDRVTCAIKCNNETECPAGEDELDCPDCEADTPAGCIGLVPFFTDCSEYTDEFRKIPGYALSTTPLNAPTFQTEDSCKQLCINNSACINFQMFYITSLSICVHFGKSLKDAIAIAKFAPSTSGGSDGVFTRVCKVC